MNVNEEKEQDIIAYYVCLFIEIAQKYFTVTGWIRTIAPRLLGKEYLLPKAFYTGWVLFWLFLILSFSFVVNKYATLLIVYRFWEMFIVNVWLFLIYRKIGRGRKDPFDYIRVVISLSWQYLTVLIGYSVIYRIIYFNNVNSFIGIKEDSIFTWIYFSMTTVTTLGYGDIYPSQNCRTAQFAVITEVFFGILYIVWFLGAIINKLEMQWSIENK
jgi:hypothetical protein